MDTTKQTAEQTAEVERTTPMRRAEKFTPGPWLDCGEGCLRTPGGAYVGTRVIEAKGWGRIIEILDESNESDANFRLILKAPELYAALQELEGWARARENTMGDPCRLLECQDGVRRAIGKARALLEEITG